MVAYDFYKNGLFHENNASNFKEEFLGRKKDKSWSGIRYGLIRCDEKYGHCSWTFAEGTAVFLLSCQIEKQMKHLQGFI